jgi:flagellar biosynthesis/type III secretory pathway M-ring protein FliF/YscJ
MTATMSKAKSLTLVGIASVVAIAVGAASLVWARRPDYQDVIDRVSRFVPRPPRRA